MKTLAEIKARLAEINNEIKTRGAEMTEDEIAKLEAEITELQQQRAEKEEELAKRQRKLDAIARGLPFVDEETGEVVTPKVIHSFRNSTDSNETAAAVYDTLEYRKAFMAHVCRGTAIPTEYRANATSTTTDVGAVIPTTVINQIVEKLESTGMIITLVTRTAYKGGVSIPVSTAKPTATWVNEGAGSDTQKKNITKDGMINFSYHKLRCAVAVSLEVENMALSTFEALLVNNITEAMLKALEQAIIDGDGTGKPKGILAETPNKEQKISSAKPAYKDLIDAEAALPVAYESGAVWCMSKKTFMQYYGLTDSNGQPIGRVNYGIAGKPERTLLGRPVVCCDYIKSYAASLDEGDVFAFLFNFKDYILNTNYTMGIKKYEDNATDDLVTKSVMLVDGKVVDKNSLVTIAMLKSA